MSKKKIEPSVVNCKKHAYGTITAVIRAPHEDAALSYFKGRYGVVGSLLKINSKCTYTVRGTRK